MDKFLKYLLIGIAIIVLVNLVINLFNSGGNTKLKQAITDINKSQQKLDSSLAQINYTRSKIDSIRNDITVFKSYIKDIQNRVEILDLENRSSMRNYRKYKDSLQNRLDDLYHTVDTTADDLPDFVVTDLK